MRKLNTRDVFALCRVIKASGMRAELKKLVMKLATREGEDITESVGIDTMLVIMEALAEKGSEAAIYEMLAQPFEMTAEDVAEMELPVMAEHLKQLGEMNDLKGFFNYVSGILGKN